MRLVTFREGNLARLRGETLNPAAGGIMSPRPETRTIGQMMIYFVIEQKWVTADGKQHGEVMEIADEGASGIVDVVDREGIRDTFRGTAAAFHLLADWRVVI